jgi:protein-disulfide isomerase
MNSKFAAGLVVALLAAGPARSQVSTPASAFTPAQRAEIVAIVRDALKSDPSILRDAVTALQTDEGVRHEAAMRAAIGAARPQLTGLPTDQVMGNPAGDVTLVEFYDVRCPYCRRMLPVFDTLLAQDHHVRLVLKDLPILGPASVLGARALIAAQRQGGYVKLQNAIMNGPPDITEASLNRQATAVGLDWGRLQRDMADPGVQQRIDANLALARALSIDGTPAIVVGEQVMSGAADLAQLKGMVAQARQ